MTLPIGTIIDGLSELPVARASSRQYRYAAFRADCRLHQGRYVAEGPYPVARSEATIRLLVGVQSSRDAFVAFNNDVILNALDVSEPLETLLQSAVARLVALSIHGDDVIDGERLRYDQAHVEYAALKLVRVQVRDRMRTEMTEGFRPATDILRSDAT